MGKRGLISVLIVSLFVTSIFAVSDYSELPEENTVFFADSEPELLISAGSSTGHVNGSEIEWTPQEWLLQGILGITKPRRDSTASDFCLQSSS